MYFLIFISHTKNEILSKASSRFHIRTFRKKHSKHNKNNPRTNKTRPWRKRDRFWARESVTAMRKTWCEFQIDVPYVHETTIEHLLFTCVYWRVMAEDREAAAVFRIEPFDPSDRWFPFHFIWDGLTLWIKYLTLLENIVSFVERGSCVSHMVRYSHATYRLLFVLFICDHVWGVLNIIY